MANKVWLIGNLTRDPELTETNSGTAVCRFSIAVNRSYTSSDGERETDFFNCTAWRGLGESVSKYCTKGSKVAVSGSVQIRNYEDNKGNKRTAVDIIAQEVEFLSKQAQSNDEEGDPYDPTPQQKPKRRTASQMAIIDSGAYDDVPF